MPSESSSTEHSPTLDDLCRCGHPWRRHLEPPGAQCTACPGGSERSWRHEFAPEKPEHRCNACGHTEGEGCGCSAHSFVSREHCDRCEGTWLIKNAKLEEKPEQRDSCPHCGSEEHRWAQCALYEQAVKADEPPLAPEEEEKVSCSHESWDVTSEWYDHLSQKWHKSRRCNDCGEGLDVVFEDEPHFPQNRGKGKRPKKPQPQRRPPYAVAYSVGNHAYEIALPGDAAVAAVDGALIITHSLGPVAGIVQARPLEGEQS